MRIIRLERNGTVCAAVEGDGLAVRDTQSALDVLMSANYEAGTKNIVLDKRQICEDFFVLSTGVAGEILQKYVNYGGRIAVYGDFSRYTSKPLKDFIRESNRGRDVFFAATKDEAVDLLTR